MISLCLFVVVVVVSFLFISTVSSDRTRETETSQSYPLEEIFQERCLFDSFVFLLTCLVSLFNGISTFIGYLTPKLFSWKNSSGTILPIAGRIRRFIPFPRVFARK